MLVMTLMLLMMMMVMMVMMMMFFSSARRQQFCTRDRRQTSEARWDRQRQVCIRRTNNPSWPSCGPCWSQRLSWA